MQQFHQDKIVVEVPDLAPLCQKSVFRVLHVDDDLCMLEVSKQILTDMGNFDIDTACGVDEAFTKLRASHYDAIISDYEMPIKNGLQFLQELREQKNDIPFVLFTGKGREDVAIEALNLGVDRYINKQGNPETVYGELSDALIKTIEHKQSKRLHAELESKYRKLVENSLQGIAIIQGPPPKFVFANSAMQELFGYSPEEMIALSPEQIVKNVHPDDRETFFDRFRKRIQGKEVESTYEFRGFRKDGTIRWVEVCANLIEFDGRPAVQAVFLDITESKKAEDKLRESQYLTHKILDCSPNLIYIFDLLENCNVYANREVLDFLGYTPEKIRSMGSELFANILHPDDAEVVAQHHARFAHASENATYEVEYRMKHASGEWRWLSSRDTLFARTQEGLGKQILGICEDITERKKAERVLEESEEKYRNLFENAPDVIVTIDLTGKITSANKAIMQYGFKENEIVGNSIFKLVPIEYNQKMVTGLKSIAAGNSSHSEIEIITPMGKRNTEYNSNPIWLNGKVVGYQSIIRDVTERKKAEEALRESEEKHRKLFEESMDAIFVADIATGILVDCNPAASKLVGWQKSELVGQHQSIIHPKGQIEGEFTGSFKQHLNDPTRTFETKVMRKTGEIRDVAVKGTIFELNGKKLTQGTFRDITERKKAEQTIKETEDRYHELVEALPEIVFEADLTGKLTFFNQTAFKSTGYTQEEFKKGLNMLQFVIPEQRERAVENIKKSLTGGSGDPHEYTLIRRDGTTYPALVKTITIVSGNKVTGLRGFLLDITDRNKNEQIMKASEEKFRNLSENSPNMIFIYQKGKVVYANKEAEKAMGYTKEEFYSSEFNFLDLITPENRDLVVSNFSKHMKGEDTAPYEYGLMTKDGRKIDGLLNAKIITYNGEPAILEIVTDITERKLMQLALQESEEKFRTITNSVKDAIIMVDNEAKVASWNPAAERTFGYSKMEAIGKKVHELIVPQTMSLESREYIRIGVQQFPNTGNVAFTNGNTELIGRKKDGTEFPIKLSITPIKLRGKWNAVGVVKDITERKLAEQRLKEAEKRYHALFNQAPLGVLVIDPQTAKPVEFNDIAHNQLGYSREEFSKLCISDFEAKEKVEETKAHLAKMVKEGGDEFETKHCTINGQIRNVLVNTRVVELAGKPFLYCVFHDITEIREVQEALMKSETQYRQLVNAAQEGIWVLDKNYGTVFVNPRMSQMLGYSESEIVGKSLFEFLDKKHIEQAGQFPGQYKQGFKGHFDYTFARKDGSRTCVSIVASAINNDEGTPIGTLAMVSDITDRKALETKVNNYSKHLKSMVELRTAQLKSANEQLVKSERLAAIGELAGMVGHDIRNPLTGIKNAAYYLKKKGTTISEAQSKEMLEIIDKSIEHANKIINDLLDYAREIHLELTESEPCELLNDALQMIQVPDRIQILNNVLGETWVSVDSDKIIRVFINLIKNAIEAMPDKGTLEITSRQTRGKVEIAFADTGTGIPKETLQKIFTPLFTTKAQGMGFGLAICKRIIEAHGGTLTVKTAMNQGTTFTITLPIKPKMEVGDKKTWVNMPESMLSTTKT